MYIDITIYISIIHMHTYTHTGTYMKKYPIFWVFPSILGGTGFPPRPCCREKECSFYSEPGTRLVEPVMAWSQGLGGAVALDSENLIFPTLRGHGYQPKGCCVLLLQSSLDTLWSLCAMLLDWPLLT